MKVLLDNCPDYITKEQRELLIAHAEKFESQYISYATTFEGVDYFYLGRFVEYRHRFYQPSFSYYDNGEIKVVTDPLLNIVINNNTPKDVTLVSSSSL